MTNPEPAGIPEELRQEALRTLQMMSETLARMDAKCLPAQAELYRKMATTTNDLLMLLATHEQGFINLVTTTPPLMEALNDLTFAVDLRRGCFPEMESTISHAKAPSRPFPDAQDEIDKAKRP